MEMKHYKVRVEVATIVEVDVWAEHEDIAAARAEQLAVDEVPIGCEDWYFCAHEVDEVEEDE